MSLALGNKETKSIELEEKFFAFDYWHFSYLGHFLFKFAGSYGIYEIRNGALLISSVMHFLKIFNVSNRIDILVIPEVDWRLKPSTNHELPNSAEGLIKPAVFEKISIISSEYIIILGIYYIMHYASTSKTIKRIRRNTWIQCGMDRKDWTQAWRICFE